MKRKASILATAFALAGAVTIGSLAQAGGPVHALASGATSAAKPAHDCSLRKTKTTCFSVTMIGLDAVNLCDLQMTGTNLMPGAPVYFAPPNYPNATQQIYDANGPMAVPANGVLNDVAPGLNPVGAPTYIFEVQAASGATLTSAPITITC